MRLIVMGQQAFGKDALAKILETGTDEIVAVYCEPDREGRDPDPIKVYAQEQGIPVTNPPTSNRRTASTCSPATMPT